MGEWNRGGGTPTRPIIDEGEEQKAPCEGLHMVTEHGQWRITLGVLEDSPVKVRS
jgi:hypothetical protein